MSFRSLSRLLAPSPSSLGALLVGLLAVCCATSAASAQVIRGVVIERTTDAPLVGVIVELSPAAGGGDRVASALTDPSGAFALRAPAAGRFVVTAKRIGVRRYMSAPIEIGAGETKTLRIVLEALDYRLPEIVVTSEKALCTSDPSESARGAAMWEEVRSALDAAQISLRDRLFSAEVTRYARELDPRTKRVVNETRSETRAVVASPILTASPESLSTFGYWSTDAKGGTIYRGPDAEALLSDAFLRDHCFHLAKGEKGRSGLTGLAFAPVAGRSVPDIVGNFWLDAKSFELRLVDFTYDRVKAGVDSSALGGEVHFARLSNGAWTVRRWFLRLPAQGRPTQPLSTEGSSPWVLVRPSTSRLSEEGGLVTTDEQRAPVRPATVEGVLRDSTGKRPLAQVQVRLTGTTLSTSTDAAGRFVFSPVPPGSYAIRATTAGYDSLGAAAAELQLALGDGETKRVELQAATTRALTERLCGEAAPFGYGTLLVTILDPVTKEPMPGIPVSASWRSALGGADSALTMRRVEAVSGPTGVATLCRVAGERELLVRANRPGRNAAEVKVTIAVRSVTSVTVR